MNKEYSGFLYGSKSYYGDVILSLGDIQFYIESLLIEFLSLGLSLLHYKFHLVYEYWYNRNYEFDGFLYSLE